MKDRLMMLVAAGMMAGMLIAGGCGGGGGGEAAPATTTTTTTTTLRTTAAVSVTGAGSSTDEGAAIATTYTFAAGTYTYSIAGFGANDKLVFPAGDTPSVDNTSYTDGKVQLSKAVNGQTITVELTGLSNATDAKLNGVADFNTVFGAGTVQ